MCAMPHYIFMKLVNATEFARLRVFVSMACTNCKTTHRVWMFALTPFLVLENPNGIEVNWEKGYLHSTLPVLSLSLSFGPLCCNPLEGEGVEVRRINKVCLYSRINRYNKIHKQTPTGSTVTVSISIHQRNVWYEKCTQTSYYCI